MLQLATLSARRASEAPDLLIILAVEQHLWLSIRPKLFRTDLAVTVAVPISTGGNSALLIGAGYMIVNEVDLNLAGCGVKPHSRRPCRPGLPRPRSPNPRTDSRLGETRVRRERCRRSLRKVMVLSASGISSDAAGLHGQHKIISDGKIIAMAADKTRLMTLDAQTSAACPRMSPDVQLSLKIGDSTLGCIPVDKPKWWSEWWSYP
jgi:hypothetical protein